MYATRLSPVAVEIVFDTTMLPEPTETIVVPTGIAVEPVECQLTAATISFGARPLVEDTLSVVVPLALAVNAAPLLLKLALPIAPNSHVFTGESVYFGSQ
jgi:hypothetical protein